MEDEIINKVEAQRQQIIDPKQNQPKNRANEDEIKNLKTLRRKTKAKLIILFGLLCIAAIIQVLLCARLRSINQDLFKHETAFSSIDGNLTFTVNGVSFVMKPVEGGCFEMGNSDGGFDETPVRVVRVNTYYMAETEVTQALWTAVMETSIRRQRKLSDFDRLRGKGDDYPMYFINWDDCQDFIAELNLKTGKKFRMPTEAEWEYAARGGKDGENAKFSGSFSIEKVAWYGRRKTSRVKNKMPNVLGLYDMSGNVWEWCNDRYDKSYIGNDTVNPQGPSYGEEYVRRGGSWESEADDCKVSNRDKSSPKVRYNDTGLRLCISL